MAESEVVVLVGCLAAAVVGWGTWLYQVFGPTSLGGTWNRVTVTLTVGVCLAALLVVLRTWSAGDVRSAPKYIAFYEILGAAWLTVAVRMTGWLGISVRDDVVERRNPAATLAIGGALLGMTACFAGGNIGNGPGWWVVVFSAGLATSALFIVWWFTEIVSQASEAVTIERDQGAGLRLGALLLAAGLVLGRAAAGDWQSADATIEDFLSTGWPVILLPIAEGAVSRLTLFPESVPADHVPLTAAVPALAYLVGAVAYVYWRGPW